MPKKLRNLQKCIVLVMMFSIMSNAQSITITGTVVDSLTSAGISGAAVKIVEFPQFSTTTAQNGSFTLNANPTGVISERTKLWESGTVSLAGNSIRVAGTKATPITVEVFSCDGSRIYHNEKVIAKGIVAFTDLWKIPGLYYVKITCNGQEQVLSSLGSVHGTSKLLSNNTISGSGLLKIAATYTLQVTASGYVQKNISFTSTATDVGTIKLVPNQDQTGVWTNVTPPGMDISGFGAGYMVVDPLRPSDFYVSGSGHPAVWKSSDFGKSWTKVSNQAGTYFIAIAHPANAPAATLWMPTGNNGSVLKSTDGGVSWKITGGGANTDLYSIQVDPYDPNHLISGLHEQNGIRESTDGGETWKNTAAAPTSSGASWYPFFINTGNASTTRTRWLAVPQPGSTGTWLTSDGGSTWTKVLPNDHPHGNCQIYQNNGAIYLAVESIYSPSYSAGGVYRSTDSGVTWTHIGSNSDAAICWGTPSHVYSMYGWAAGSLGNFSPNFQVASQPATSGWANVATPSGMVQGPNSMGVAFDGTHYVFVGSMWIAGLWRYVEP